VAAGSAAGSNLLNTRTLEHSNTRTLEHSNTRTLGHSDTRTLGHSDTRTLGHLDTWTLGHLDTHIPGHSEMASTRSYQRSRRALQFSRWSSAPACDHKNLISAVAILQAIPLEPADRCGGPASRRHCSGTMYRSLDRRPRADYCRWYGGAGCLTSQLSVAPGRSPKINKAIGERCYGLHCFA